MRSSHETWNPSQDPLTEQRTKYRDRHATHSKTALINNGPIRKPIYLRMGVHAGDILIEDQDGFATLGTCLSAVVYDQIEEKFAC